jgi:hypothetical protein
VVCDLAPGHANNHDGQIRGAERASWPQTECDCLVDSCPRGTAYHEFAPMCRQVFNAYICTRPQGHAGDHVACSPDNHNRQRLARINNPVSVLNREIQRYNEGLPVRGNGLCLVDSGNGMICTRTSGHDGSHAFAWPATAENVLREPSHRCLAIHGGTGMQCIHLPGHDDYHRVVTPDGSDWRWR